MRVCWLSTTRITNPLNPTAEKKWAALSTLAIPMDVIAFSNGWRPLKFHQHATFYLLPQLPFSLLRYLTYFTVAPWLLLWIILRHQTTLIVAQSPYDGAIAIFWKQCLRIFGKRMAVIVESHGDFELSVFIQREVTFKSMLRSIMRRVASFSLKNADVIRVISQMTRRQIQAWAPDKPVVQFMTWTDSEAFQNTPRTKSLTESHDLVYAGVLIPRKGVHFLIEAFSQVIKQVPTAHLYLVGSPDNAEYASRIVQQISTHNLQAHATVVGAVSQQELADYFAQARASILPSISEGLGRVVVESMLCGTPVIGSKVGGIPDMIRDGENGFLVPPEDVEALAATMLKILTLPTIEAMGANAQQFAKEFFSTEAYVDGYRTLFDLASATLKKSK